MAKQMFLEHSQVLTTADSDGNIDVADPCDIQLNPAPVTISRPRKRAICSLCGTGILKRTLARHIRSVHGQGQTHKYQCGECDQKFPRKDAHYRHQREQHQNEASVECTVCGKHVKERSLKDHFKSRRCRPSLNVESSYMVTSTDAKASMLEAIFEDSEQDFRLFKDLSAESTCDPLLITTYVASRLIAAEGRYDLRDLALRAIIRGLSNDIVDDHLDGAIQTLGLVDRVFDLDSKNIHDPALRWIKSQRSHRQTEVHSKVLNALHRWNCIAIGDFIAGISRGPKRRKGAVNRLRGNYIGILINLWDIRDVSRARVTE